MLPHMVVALFSALTLLAFGASSAFADNTPRCMFGNQPKDSEPYPALDYWYAQINANASSGPLATEGVRGELTRNGGPSTTDPNSQHVSLHVAAHEGTSHSQLQTGWTTGAFTTCPPSVNTSTGRAINVYVEIYDDTGGNASCYASLFEPAPWGASYEVAYAGRDGNYYQYRAYYQGPGEQIQYLGWGDYNSLYLSPSAVGEVQSPLKLDNNLNLVPQTCPILGQNSIGHWNELGFSPSSTFASVLQIYNGSSWVNWPAGSPLTTTVTQDAPYKLATPTPYSQLWNTGGQP